LYRFLTNGIAWPADATRYGESAYKSLSNLTTRVVPPPFWREAFPEYADGYTASNFPDLKNNERFQVWMRTAGLPTFRKLWGANRDSLLPKGIWEVTINQKFAVSKFGGTKSIVISNTSILGGKNSFLGAAYVVVGTLCIALGIAFLIRNMINPRFVIVHVENWVITNFYHGIKRHKNLRTRTHFLLKIINLDFLIKFVNFECAHVENFLFTFHVDRFLQVQICQRCRQLCIRWNRNLSIRSKERNHDQQTTRERSGF
jgi:hypothetical protein